MLGEVCEGLLQDGQLLVSDGGPDHCTALVHIHATPTHQQRHSLSRPQHHKDSNHAQSQAWGRRGEGLLSCLCLEVEVLQP